MGLAVNYKSGYVSSDFLLFYGSVQRAWNWKWEYSLEVTVKPPTVVLILACLIHALLKLSPDAGITAGQKMASC